MRLAICMPHGEMRSALVNAVGSEMIRRDIAFSLAEYHRFRDLLYELEDGWAPDILLLAVSDADSAESEVAAVRAAGFTAKLVLLGGDIHCAARGYDWGVDGFWPLPMDPVRAVERLEALFAALHNDCLTVRSRRVLYHVPHADIVCVESNNNKCVVYRLSDEALTVYSRLDDLEQQLHDTRFLRCHQSYLINMDHVRSVDKCFELADGRIASICQRRLKAIREQYLVYVQRRSASTTSNRL